MEQIQIAKQLWVSTISPHNVRWFIRNLADPLTLLDVDFAMCDIGADIVFPHLTHLHCQLFDAETASAFPRLTELFIEDTMELTIMMPPGLKRLLFASCPDNLVRLLIRESLRLLFIQSNSENLGFLYGENIKMKFGEQPCSRT